MPRVRIYNINARRLKDGSYTVTGIISSDVPRAAILPYEDGVEVYLTDESKAPTEADRVAERAAAFDRIRSIVIDVDATEVREVIESKQEVPF